MNKLATAAALSAVLLTAVTSTDAALYTFGVSTGVFTLLDSSGAPLQNTSLPYSNDPTWDFGYRTQISGSITFDTVTGAGIADIAPFDFLGAEFTFQPLHTQAIGDSFGGPGTFIELYGLWDWNGYTDVPFSLVWDGAGLENAIGDHNIAVGEKISGNELLTPPAVVGDPWDVRVPNLGGATPASNGIRSGLIPTGPIPLATTTWNTTCSICGNDYYDWVPLIPNSIGGSPMPTGPFTGYSINLDMGIVGSMVLTSVVPVPAAAWLFGSGLIGLIGVARRKAA